LRAPRLIGAASPPNKSLHPTADTPDVMFLNLAGRRVIGGIMLLRKLLLGVMT
jgi:hypothetical protein